LHRQYQDGDSAWKLQFMINKWSFYIGILVVVGFISSAFRPFDTLNQNGFHVNENEELLYQFPSESPLDYINQSLPYLGKHFVGFKEAIAIKESQGQYRLVNSLGYMGKYQFGTSALRFIGINNNSEFLNSPDLQEKAFVALLKINKSKLQDVIEEYRGKTIGGVRVTESGILAAAHLGGAGSVRKYLESNGKRKCKDGYGTTVKSYLKQFSGYETHNIKADSTAKVR
jgi:hypothetical protein